MQARGSLFVVLAAACSSPTSPGFDAAVYPVAPVDAGCLGAQSPGYGPCVCHSDCASSGTCAPESRFAAPGGFCIQGCDAGGAAPAGYRCDPGQTGQPWLVPTCDATNRCRDGYSCFFDSVADGGYCRAQCSRDTNCPGTGHCDPYTKLCQSERDDGGGLAAACTRHEDCKSVNCHPASGQAPNFCWTSCNTRDRVCPEGGTCVALFAPTDWTDGLCVRRCEDAGTCSQGFRCSANGNCLPNW